MWKLFVNNVFNYVIIALAKIQIHCLCQIMYSTFTMKRYFCFKTNATSQFIPCENANLDP